MTQTVTQTVTQTMIHNHTLKVIHTQWHTHSNTHNRDLTENNNLNLLNPPVYHCVYLSVLRVLMVIICHYERLSSYISVCATFFLLFICYLCPLDAFHFLCWLFCVSHCLSVIKNVFLCIIMCVYMFICHYLYHYAHHF